ncbi:CopG family ribbon-helix-helix protein [Sphingopyxis granuli]|uniref:CopG family ribbon-helix-helix protein n=1 Tax=Sphingopyxis granuli TaxID=267128 RepID=UPI00082DA902|nr:ribbon-helix-helix protein, CopG family [Sphingopyxis granuli]
MTKQTVISARVDEAMLDDLDRIAAFHDRSRAWVIVRLLQQAVAHELEYVELVEPALEDVAAGRLIPHEEVMADIKARLAARKAA